MAHQTAVKESGQRCIKLYLKGKLWYNNAMASKSRGGLSKREYEKKTGKKSSSSSSKKSSSGDEKKAKKQVEKYYGEKEADIKAKAELETKRLQEDLAKLMADVGIAQTRATEDYIRNIGNIESNKAIDVAGVTDYVQTNTGRTQEDLDTELAKEYRRFSLESDQINESLADKGLTFSDRTPEKIARETSRLTTTGIQTEAARSFQDIARYEVAKNMEIQNKYGQQTEEATKSKVRTLEDILNEQNTKAQAIQRGEQDIAFGKATDLRDIEYGKNDAVSTIGNFYDAQENSLSNKQEIIKVQGV